MKNLSPLILKQDVHNEEETWKTKKLIGKGNKISARYSTIWHRKGTSYFQSMRRHLGTRRKMSMTIDQQIIKLVEKILLPLLL